MKTIQPKDWSKTPEDYLKESRMGESEQKVYLRTSIAYLVVFGFAVWMIAVSLAGLWAAFLEAIK